VRAQPLQFGVKAMIFAIHFGREVLGLLLIAALVTTMATAAVAEADHASAPLAAPAEHPAGCHAPGGNTLPDSQLPHSPRPAPVSYQCCLTGHDAAVVQASHFPQPSAQCAHAARQIESALTAHCLDGLDVPVVLSVDPPSTIPLRI